MMLTLAEARRVGMHTQLDASAYSDVAGGSGDGLNQVAERVHDMMSSPSLQEVVDQVVVLRDVDGGDAFADQLVWDAVEVLMQNPIFKSIFTLFGFC